MRRALSLAFTAATLAVAISASSSAALGRGFSGVRLPDIQAPAEAAAPDVPPPGYEAIVTAPLPVARAIHTSAVRHGVPVEVVAAVAWQESRFKQGARSHKGAMGVMQLTGDTADYLGVDPHDLNDNVDGGAAYLSKLMRRFGDTRLALAAYNAGPENVKRYGGIPPFRETQTYVTRIVARLDREGSPAV